MLQILYPYCSHPSHAETDRSSMYRAVSLSVAVASVISGGIFQEAQLQDVPSTLPGV